MREWKRLDIYSEYPEGLILAKFLGAGSFLVLIRDKKPIRDWIYGVETIPPQWRSHCLSPPKRKPSELSSNFSRSTG